jgi:hypothetical protein
MTALLADAIERVAEETGTVEPSVESGSARIEAARAKLRGGRAADLSVQNTLVNQTRPERGGSR